MDHKEKGGQMVIQVRKDAMAQMVQRECRESLDWKVSRGLMEKEPSQWFLIN